MRSITVLGWLISAASAQSLLSISPQVITQCTFGHGRATLSWNAPAGATVRIRIGDRTGVPMTGLTTAVGSAETGDWIDEGMVFVLVNEVDFEYARVTAHVNCAGTADTTGAALTASTVYRPLRVGNQWVYRVNDRAFTSQYKIETITRTMQVGSNTYFVLETRSGPDGIPTEALIRSDESGRLLVLSGTEQNLTEQVLLDPSGGKATQSLQKKDVQVNTPAGQLPVGLNYQSLGFTTETGTYARGLGLLDSNSILNAGSSGGFQSSSTLVESRVGSGLYFSTPAASVEVAAEATLLNVSGRQVTNCAVPCYFVACSFAPGADPPNTYKPCFQARVRVGRPQCSSSTPVVATIELRNDQNTSLYTRDIRITLPVSRCESAAYHQLPLYSAPNVPLPPGVYRLNLRVTGEGNDLGSASVPLRLE